MIDYYTLQRFTRRCLHVYLQESGLTVIEREDLSVKVEDSTMVLIRDKDPTVDFLDLQSGQNYKGSRIVMEPTFFDYVSGFPGWTKRLMAYYADRSAFHFVERLMLLSQLASEYFVLRPSFAFVKRPWSRLHSKLTISTYVFGCLACPAEPTKTRPCCVPE